MKDDRRGSMKEERRPSAVPRVTNEPVHTEQLFREHAPFIAAFLHRLGVHDSDVDDAVQEVFMVAHEKGGYRPGPALPRSWLGAIAWRVAASRRRSLRRRREDFDDAALRSAAAEGRSPADAADIAEQLLRVQVALDSLDDELRATFVLYEIEGEPCGSIAEAMGVPTGTVYSRLHNARKRFAEAYARLGRVPASERVATPIAGVA